MDISIGSILTLAAFGLGLVLVVSFVIASCFTTAQQTKRIIERFGKFVSVRGAGFGLKLGWFDRASNPISLRTQQLDLQELTYTAQGTSCTIFASVMYKVDENDQSVKDAYYKLANPEAQIKAHVSSAIRNKVPTMSLEDVQRNQREIASFVKAELTETMRQYGYVIEDVLVTKADPDQTVVQANNEKYASEQAKVTAKNNAEANYTRVTRQAEADRDAMKAHGEGIALEREAITAGLKKSVEELSAAVPGTTPSDALRTVAFQQYVDMLAKLAANGSSKVIFVPTSPSGSADIFNQLQTALMSASEAGKPAAPRADSQTDTK